MDGLTEGRIVHFVMPRGNSVGQHRPAIVVNAWKGVYSDGKVNLHVFTDFGNDGKEFASGDFWATSVPYDPDGNLGTWHWIEPA